MTWTWPQYSLRLRENVTVVNGKAVLGALKTESGVRDLRLAPETVKLLQQHLQAKGGHTTGYVFTNVQGQRLYPDSLTKLAGKIAWQAGLGNVRFHDLRHTCASLILGKGVPMEVVSEKLGHSRASTTADIYRHVFLEEHVRHTIDLTDLLMPRPLKISCATQQPNQQNDNDSAV